MSNSEKVHSVSAERHTQNVARRHHFVSEGYLRQFTDTVTGDGKVCVLDLRENRRFSATPRNIAVETDFNRIDLPGFEPDYLEKTFAQQLEGKAASVLRWICDNGEIPANEDFSYVLNLATLFAVRNPAMRRSMEAARKQEIRIVFDLLASDRRLYEDHLAKAREQGFITGADVPFEKMRGALRADFTLDISPQEHLATELAVFSKVLRTVCSRYWSLLIAGPDAPDFITCDHPVSLVFKQVVFPIGPRHALMGDRARPRPYRMKLTGAGVSEVNARIVRLADRHVYSRFPEIAF